MSPPYVAVTDPEPADVPVNITEQLVTPAVVDKLQVVADSEPPVLPAVSANVTIPVGAFAAVVVSTTVAVTEAEQLVPPSAMLQLTFGTVVEVLSLAVISTITTVAGALLPLCVESPP